MYQDYIQLAAQGKPPVKEMCKIEEQIRTLDNGIRMLAQDTQSLQSTTTATQQRSTTEETNDTSDDQCSTNCVIL